MASVTFPAGVGGDGSTVTDDANPTTGLANGGHRTRFVPALSQMVAVAQNTVTQATAAAAAAVSAVNAPGTQATSTTSTLIGTGSKTFTIQTGKAFALGQWVMIASSANVVANYMYGTITAHNSVTGSLTVNVSTSGGSGTFSDWVISLIGPPGEVTLNGGQTLTNKTLAAPNVNNQKLNTTRELVTVSATAATGTINFDALTQSVLFYTSSASANWTVNLRGDGSNSLNTMLAVGESLTVAFLVTQGATPYYNTTVQVDGATAGVTTRWQGSAAPAAGNASGVDVYTYTIIKTASATFTVLAAQTQFK